VPPLILPGATIGVLGSGQLGRMFAIAARKMGYRVHTYSPGDDTPTGQVADREINGAYEDLDSVRRFAAAVDVLTFEFENVPSATTDAAEAIVPVRPHGTVLHTTQHRLREKLFLQQAGIPLAPFVPVRSAEDLSRALETVGRPAVLKTAGWGYDGKGQVKITWESGPRDAEAWASLGTEEGVLEGFIGFSHEASVVAARGTDGSFVHYGLLENTHTNHILDTTLSPGRLPVALEREAADITRTIMERLDVVGVLCVEFFVTQAGKLLVNELAPRPHNSGHVTFDNCVTSQFEQQLRAICGLPLGATDRFCAGAMANLLGDLWANGEPRWAAALAHPSVKLHLYALAATPEEALVQAQAARNALTQP
jgi:5-(carboxyamino)imidazole ribonucleotide synthase